MAVDKTKLVQQAQKFIVGQKWDKAIECYEQIAKIEPRDTRVRQKIAELHARRGDIPNALKSYAQVADQYTREGFYQKALAVYKQMLQIKPDFIPAYEALAEVSIKLGLNSDAINYIKVVIAQHEKEGRVLEALDAIKKLIEIDPGNIASQIKLAELYAREGHKDDAVNQLAGLIPQFERSQSWDELLRIRERICHYDPSNQEQLKAYYKLLMKLGRYQPAFQPLQRYIKLNREEVEAIEDLAFILRQLGNGQHEKVALKELARRLGENADPKRLEEIYSRIIEVDPSDQGAADYLAALRAEMTTDDEAGGGEQAEAEVDIANDDMIGGDEDLVGEEDDEDGGDTLIDEDVEIAGQEQLDTMLVGTVSGGDIQPDQIDAYLTEADVYVKYGLIEKAVNHLQKLIASKPDCLPAYEKMRDVLSAGSRGGEFAGIVKSGTDLLKARGKDTSALQALLTPGAAAKKAAPPSAPEIDPDIAAVVAETKTVDEQISDELADAVSGALDASLPDNEPAPPPAPASVSHEVSIEIDLEEPSSALVPPAPPPHAVDLDVDLPEAGADSSNPLAGADLDTDLSFNMPEPPPSLEAATDEPLGGESLEAGLDLAPPPAPLAPPATLEAEEELSAGPLPDFDESSLGAPPPPEPASAAPVPAAPEAARPALAKPVISKPVIQKPTISRPEIARPPAIAKPQIAKPPVVTPPKPASAPAPVAAKPAPVIAKPSIAKPALVKPGLATPAGFPKPALPKPPLAKPGLTLAPPKPAAPALKPPLAKPAAPAPAGVKPLAPGLKPALPKLAPLPKPAFKPLAAPSFKPAPKLAEVVKDKFAADFEQIDFEIQQGLYDEARITIDMILTQDPSNAKAKQKLNELMAAEKITREEADGNFVPEFGGGEQVSVDSVLKAFQAGVDKTVAKEDFQTRFDLGLAYREMGLFSEAEREFRLALDGNGARRPDCWNMIGLCQMESGDPAAAVQTFEQGLSETADAEPRHNLAYELANAKMAAGQKPDAMGLLLWLEGETPGFRQTAELVAQLRSEGIDGGPVPPPSPEPRTSTGSRANVSYV